MALCNNFEYLATGRITKVGFSQNPNIQVADDPLGTLVVIADPIVVSSVTEYYDTANKEIIARPANPATIDKTTITADGVDEAVLSNIPNPSTVTITSPVSDTITATCTDGIAEISADFAGEYTITINSFPEQDITFTVIAT